MWIPLVVVLVILAAIGLSYVALAAPIPEAPTADSELIAKEIAAQRLEIARMEADARRNALATGAGFVAIAALVLGFHRQRHHERTTANAEADALRRQEHAERTAAATEHDSLQRRITDARIRAVDQLGSDNPTVRIGGLHNLERIGQQHPELRQVVLDEVCSYLRLPYTPTEPAAQQALSSDQFEPVEPPSPVGESTSAEREVRLIAQEILQRHLRSDDEQEFWKHSRVNLKNAWLQDMDLVGCALTSADFTNATFSGRCPFWEEVTFDEGTSFEGATFGKGMYFLGTIFNGEVRFAGSRFSGDAHFRSMQFNGPAYFDGADFGNQAHFGDCTFAASATFQDFFSRFPKHDVDAALAHDWAFEETVFTDSARHLLPDNWQLKPMRDKPGWSKPEPIERERDPSEAFGH
jgi:hypothetical protein